MDTLEDELIGKTVMSKEGFFIGIIKSLLVDRNTGGPKSISHIPHIFHKNTQFS